MSSAIQLGNVRLLPVKDAAEFVPYSRDYVARLAREGKVVATQIDRQWFVDVTSLQNFFSHASIEESVRKRHLSTLRKRDLEVREVYRARLDEIAQKRTRAHRATIVHTCLVLCCGLIAGSVFIAASHVQSVDSVRSLAREVGLLAPAANEAAVVVRSVSVANILPGVNNPVVETDESFDVSRGIVVLPNGSTSSSTVEDFFSDPVTVEMTSTTSGNIRNTISNKTVPFVRVPSEAVVVPPKSNGTVVTP